MYIFERINYFIIIIIIISPCCSDTPVVSPLFNVSKKHTTV